MPTHFLHSGQVKEKSRPNFLSEMFSKNKDTPTKHKLAKTNGN
jgi:hypothetical protein